MQNLNLAIRTGNLSLVSTILSENDYADFEKKILNNGRYTGKNHLLYDAAKYGKLAILQLLIEKRIAFYCGLILGQCSIRSYS